MQADALRNQLLSGWRPQELLPGLRSAGVLVVQGTEGLPCHSSRDTGHRTQCPSPTQAALWGIREALCKSSHGSAQNLGLPPQPHCEKVPRTIGYISWARISGSQAISSSLVHFSFPLFSSVVPILWLLRQSGSGSWRKWRLCWALKDGKDFNRERGKAVVILESRRDSVCVSETQTLLGCGLIYVFLYPPGLRLLYCVTLEYCPMTGNPSNCVVHNLEGRTWRPYLYRLHVHDMCLK